MKRSAHFIILFAVLVLVCAGLLLILNATFDRHSCRLWTGYYTFVFKKSSAGIAQKQLAVWGELLSYDTVRVKVFTFNAMESFALKDMDGRFASEDPRIDPYIRGLPAYFLLNDGWEAAYLRTDKPLFALLPRLIKQWPGFNSDWFLAEYDVVPKILSVILMLFYGVLLIFTPSSKDRRGFNLVCLCPYLFLAFCCGNVYIFIACFLVFTPLVFYLPGWLEAVEELLVNNWKGSFRLVKPQLVLTFTLVIFGVMLCLTNLRWEGIFNAAVFLLALILHLVLVFAIILLRYLRQRFDMHRLFKRVPLRPAASTPGVKVRKRLAALAAGIFSSAVIVLGCQVGGSSFKLPAPQVRYAQAVDWTSLTKLWQEKTPSSLPNLADYLAHLAYQENLKYGYTYQLPQPDQRLYINHYVRTNSVITQEPVRVAEFNQQWLAEALWQAESDSIESMLFTQGGAMNISKQRTNSRVSLGIPWKVIVLMLYLLLGWAIFKGWTIRVFYDIRHIALKQVKFVNKLLPNRLKKNARAV